MLWRTAPVSMVQSGLVRMNWKSYLIMTCMGVAGALHSPMPNTVNSYNPYRVRKAVQPIPCTKGDTTHAVFERRSWEYFVCGCELNINGGPGPCWTRFFRHVAWQDAPLTCSHHFTRYPKRHVHTAKDGVSLNLLNCLHLRWIFVTRVNPTSGPEGWHFSFEIHS